MRLEFIIVLLSYIFIGSILALISRRYFKRDIGDYYTASGRLGPILAAGTYAATTYSAFMMIGLVGLAYATGVGALGFELVYLCATIILLSTIGVKIWEMSKRKGWIAPSQMIGDLYNSKLLAVIVSAVYIFAMIPYLSAQIMGLTHIFEYGGFKEIEALLVSSIIVYAWIAVAGMWSVALTDLYQGLIMITCGLSYLLWTMFYFLPSNGINLGEITGLMMENNVLGLTSFWSFGVFTAYTIPWAFFAITNPQVVVRLYLHRDYDSYRKSLLFFFIFGF
ncbi:MAG: sodium:solute symporter family protein, partial [Desulfurococcaceae archaeon]